MTAAGPTAKSGRAPAMVAPAGRAVALPARVAAPARAPAPSKRRRGSAPIWSAIAVPPRGRRSAQQQGEGGSGERVGGAPSDPARFVTRGGRRTTLAAG